MNHYQPNLLGFVPPPGNPLFLLYPSRDRATVDAEATPAPPQSPRIMRKSQRSRSKTRSKKVSKSGSESGSETEAKEN